MTIQAIETRYAGRRFRSRLEARWSVFFDRLGVRWDYEPQGYMIDGMPYLPDFWLPDANVWVEVKGVMTAPMLRTLIKAAWWGGLPVNPYTEQPPPPSAIATLEPRVLVLGDIPTGANRSHIQLDVFGGHVFASPVMWIRGRYGSRPTVWRPESATRGIVITPALAHEATLKLLSTMTQGTKSPWAADSRVLAAYDAARTARFEHGECP